MDNYSQLKELLNELFELNKADLDFGIYRIMNQKRKQVNEFIDKRLPEDIKKTLSETQTTDKAELEKELKEMKKSLEALDISPEENAKYKAKLDQLNLISNTDVLEQEVFSHLINFFKRYYKDGDFISMRRYKRDVYAIPYEGEEVKLYWANHDQYYIKSSENFKNYSFVLPGDKKVTFQLKEVSTEQNNNKTQGDAERRFALYDECPVEENGNELCINFTYEPFPKATKQESLLSQAIETLTTKIPASFAGVFSLKPTEKNKSRTLLEKHLNDYVSKNTFDYFIHKDLAGFLNRELDFYIKNEVLFLDDINAREPEFFTAQLSKIKAMKVVAQKIIEFLAQIENFQKKLWLKKKFVVSTNYCITLDRIPETYYPEIFQNKAQLAEWKSLFDVDIQNETQLTFEPFLVLDTKFFDEPFKDRILAEFDSLDDQTDGFLFNSENFQALGLMQEKYREKISAEIIDPPYNTGEDGFIYKDNFKSSSWLSLLFERLELGRLLLCDDGNISINIDENEENNLCKLISVIFGEENNLGKIIWDKRNPKGDAKGIATQHEYIQLANKNADYSKKLDDFLFREKSNAQELLDKAAVIIKKHKGVTDAAKKEYKEFVNRHPLLSGGERAYNSIDDNGEPYQSVSMAWPNKEKAPEDYYIPLIHPVSKKECPVPAKGWRNPPVTMLNLLNNNLILFGKDERTQPRRKYFLKENLNENLSSLYYLGGSDDTLFDDLGIQFPNPKPWKETSYLITSLTSHQSSPLLLDFFAGSGTLAHSAIKENRIGKKSYKYILVDVGGYFEKTLLFRTKRIIFSDNWKSGKPQDKKGISQLVKYQVLESYEDTLNNLQLKPVDSQTLQGFSDRATEEYLLQYMLEFESHDHLCNIDMFRKPFDYQINITENNELKPVKVDLVETFNYLIGLYVNKVQRVKDIKVVEGVTRTGVNTLVIWRDLDTTTHDDVVTLIRRFYDSARTAEFDHIYINGDHHLENLRQDGDQFKIKQIEDTFFKKMFNESEW